MSQPLRILLVNPNSTASMTAAMSEAARSVVAAGTDLLAATAEYGPESIEGYYDEVFSVPPLVDAVRAQQAKHQIDGVVVGCFDDTGVDALRALLDAPVIGICQAAMQAAATLAGNFSVVTTLGRSVAALEHLSVRYGYERLCRRVRSCEVPVLELEDPESDATNAIRQEIEAALRDDGAEAIVLGCAGMLGLTESLSEEYSVPVIEGVTVAVKWVEALAGLGLSTSKRGGYAPPREKLYRGEFSRYTP